MSKDLEQLVRALGTSLREAGEPHETGPGLEVEDLLAALALAFKLKPQDLGSRGRALMERFNRRAGTGKKLELYLRKQPLSRKLIARVQDVLRAGATKSRVSFRAQDGMD